MLGISFPKDLRVSSVALALYLSLSKFLLYIFTGTRFGFHRDELYYLACSHHLDLGYVDHPPLIALLARFWIGLFGSSLFSVRFLPAVAGAAIVFLTGLVVREFGGKAFAVFLACLSVIIAPVLLCTDRLFTTNVFDQLFWITSIYLIIKILKYDRPKLWIAVGIIIGAGMMNKHSVVFLIGGLVLGLILTSQRRHFRNKYLWLGMGLALIIIVPNIVWQIAHGWPTIEFLRAASINRPIGGSVPGFLKQIVFSFHPLTLPVWVAGLYFLLFSKEGRGFRSMGILAFTILFIFAVQKSKDYYLAPVFPLLFAAGAVLLEKVFRKGKLRALRPVSVGIMLMGGAALSPLSIPVLSLNDTVKYCRYLEGGLHPVYADMLGWESMVKTVAAVYNSLPREEKNTCAIMTQNYGEAAAIDFYGRKYGMPKSISPHNSYWLWGPRDYTGEVLITVGITPQGLSQGFGYYETAATVVNDYAMWYETNLPVIIWRKPRLPLASMWPAIKVYY